MRQSAIDNHPKSYGRAPEITAFAANTNRSPATLLTKKTNKQVKPKGQRLFSLTGEQRPLYIKERSARDKTLHSPASPTKTPCKERRKVRKTQVAASTNERTPSFKAPHGVTDDWKTPSEPTSLQFRSFKIRSKAWREQGTKRVTKSTPKVPFNAIKSF